MGEQKPHNVQQLMQRAMTVARRAVKVEGAAWGEPISKWKMPELIEEIRFSGNKRRIPVIVELGRRGGDEAVETLTKLILSEPSNTIKSCAILALGRIVRESLENDLKEKRIPSSDTMSLLGNMHCTFCVVMAPLKAVFGDKLNSGEVRDPVSGSIRVVNESITKILGEARM